VRAEFKRLLAERQTAPRAYAACTLRRVSLVLASALLGDSQSRRLRSQVWPQDLLGDESGADQRHVTGIPDSRRFG
jgi:hypothetical protein